MESRPRTGAVLAWLIIRGLPERTITDWPFLVHTRR